MMKLPININDILKARTFEWERLEFKEGWNPVKVMRTMCAFANDFNNLGGGYIVLGVSEKNGQPELPPVGIPNKDIDAIQKEIVKIGYKIIPYYHPIISPCYVNGKTILVLWAMGGQNRPYKAPISLTKGEKGFAYYIRKGSTTVQARHQEEMELMTLAANVPFDDRMNHHTDLKKLDLGLIRSYLQKVDSDLFDDSIKIEFTQLCRQMNIIDGPDEAVYPKNVGLMFFNDDPSEFFPQTQIDVVYFPDGPGADTFSETTFKGPLHVMLKNALAHIHSLAIEEKVIKHPDRPEASRFFSYPLAAIEEALCNAVYHRSYEIREPIEIRILPDRISILSFPGPDRSITDNDMREFRFLSRRYRNRRIGDFLKELDMTEGRGTGIPKILRAIQVNSSPLPKLITDKDRTYFLSEFPIHSSFTQQQSTSENFGILRKTSEKKFNQTLMLMKETPTLTIAKIAETLNISNRAVEMQIHYLKKEGLLKRVGSRRNGRWEVR